MEGVLHTLSSQLQSAVLDENPTGCRKDVYKRFIEQIRIGEKQTTTCPEFAEYYTSGPQWVNTTEPLPFRTTLSGKIVVLDFWTYCCINCMHILPDLHELEKKYPVAEGVVIIGVHSAKFPNEKDTDNITSAVRRYGIEHAVVNDTKAALWHQLGIQCWPTIVILGPDGKLLTQFIGEGHRQEIIEFVGCALETYHDMIKPDPLPISPGVTSQSPYPTKVTADDDTLIISDAGLHKIFILSLNELKVQAVVGSGVKGHKDGTYSECQFVSPQGACKVGDALYVVDSDTHHLRKICLKSETVTTISGTGALGNDNVGGKSGVNQVLSSPWDVKKYCSKHSQTSKLEDENVDMLLIAMAGTHQIWAYFIKDVTWWKNQIYTAGTCVAIVGSGQEENRNNSYPMKCGLAQPSALSIDYINSMCYIADSESSTIRQLNLKTGQVMGMLGGDRDPMNLFAFGDKDGKGIGAKIQHPLDVCHIPNTDYAIICDSYNHKLKLMKVSTKSMQATSMTLTIPDVVMDEPGGISYHSQSRYLYIADTNNHSVKRISLPEVISDTMQLTNIEQVLYDISEDETDSIDMPLFKHESKSVIKSVNEPLSIDFTAGSVRITESLPENSHLTTEADSVYRAYFTSQDRIIHKAVKGRVEAVDGDCHKMQIIISTENIPAQTQDNIDTINIEVVLYYCSDSDNVCMRKNLLITQPVECKR